MVSYNEEPSRLLYTTDLRIPKVSMPALPKADALPTWDNPSAGTSSTTIKYNDYFAYLASAEELANSLDEADEEDKLRALNEAIQNAKAAYDGLASLPNLQQKNVDDIVAALKSRHHRRDGVGANKKNFPAARY